MQEGAWHPSASKKEGETSSPWLHFYLRVAFFNQGKLITNSLPAMPLLTNQKLQEDYGAEDLEQLPSRQKKYSYDKSSQFSLLGLAGNFFSLPTIAVDYFHWECNRQTSRIPCLRNVTTHYAFCSHVYKGFDFLLNSSKRLQTHGGFSTSKSQKPDSRQSSCLKIKECSPLISFTSRSSLVLCSVAHTSEILIQENFYRILENSTPQRNANTTLYIIGRIFVFAQAYTHPIISDVFRGWG